MKQERLAELPVVIGWPIAVAGLLAVFATYWDEAWHTDGGWDSALAAPHLLLYGSIAVVGLGVASWGLRVLIASRSFRVTLAQPPLLAATLGALGALIAAPIDAAWHEAYGRDAVLFSPPHMLVVLASTGLVLGVLAGLPAGARTLRASVGVLMLANAAAVVFEYEADVPQFSEVYYLPLLLLVGLPAVWVVREAVPMRFPATAVVLGYAALRLAISGALLALGRSTPDLPIAVLGLAALDLPLRRATMRVAAAAVATSILAWVASVGSLVSPVALDVGRIAAPVIVAGSLYVLVASRRGLLVAPMTVLLAVAVLTLGSPQRAEAHDPGQGKPVARLQLTSTTDAAGRVVLDAKVAEHCDDLEPRAVVGRRAGDVVTSALEPTGACGFRGALSLPEEGRWFVYAEFIHASEPVEAWLPVDVGMPGTLAEDRDLYVPAGEGVDVTTTQVLFGGLIYGLGFGLLGMGVRATRSGRRHGANDRPTGSS